MNDDMLPSLPPPPLEVNGMDLWDEFYVREAQRTAYAKCAEDCIRILQSVGHDNPLTANDCIDAIRALISEKGEA